MKTTRNLSRCPGYSLAELMTAVGVITAVAGISLGMVTRIKGNTEFQKLKGDMASLNRASQVYIANGGWFETSTDVDSMLAKLKTYPLSTQRQTIVGLRGPMVDMRVKAIPMNEQEEATTQPRAVWDTAKNQLIMRTTGPGIKEFVLGPVPPVIEEIRNSTVEYASVSDWVWDYGTDTTNDRPNYGGDLTLSDESPSSVIGGNETDGDNDYYLNTLQSPLFSLPGGFYEYTNFPLLVTLSNPNPAGTSQIMYRMGDDSWDIYNGGNIVVPGDYSTTVHAYCSSIHPDFWANSVVAEEIYETLYISGSSDGDFTDPDGDSGLVYTITDTEDGSIFTWGTPASGYSEPSSLEFHGTSFDNISPEQEFVIGTLDFYNGTIVSGTGANGVELDLDLDLTVNIPIATEEITFTFELINTPNHDWQTNDENADYVRIQVPQQEFTTTYNGVTYYIDLSFGDVGSNGFSTIDEFHVWENHSASGTVLAKITTTPPDELDEVPPTVVLWTQNSSVNGQFEVLATFSELVNGFSLNAINATNGSKSDLEGNSIDYSFFVTPSEDGLITIQVPAGVVVDGVGNPNSQSNLLEVIADLTPPMPALAYDEPESGYKNNNGHGNNIDGVDSSNPGWASGHGPNGAADTNDGYDDEIIKGKQGNPYKVTGPITVDVTFDEPVSGLAFEDFVVTGATLSDLDVSGSTNTVVVTLDEGAEVASLSLVSGAVVDGVGNGSIEPEPIYIAMDGNNPTVTLTTPAAEVDGSFYVYVETSEKVYGFGNPTVMDDVTVTNGVVSEPSSSGNQRNFSFRVTPQESGPVSISIPSAAFADDALNPNFASNLLTVNYAAASYINFEDYAIHSYGGWQDQGDSSIHDSGAMLYIKNNAWKSIDYDVTVTADTVLEFEFWSNKQGEVHGIGLDDDEWLSSSKTFRVYGTQNDWGDGSYDNYSSSDGWKSYSIPVGQFYTGNFNRMVFVADHDSNPRNGRSKFRNVRVFTP